jgi:hypothetical protein
MLLRSSAADAASSTCGGQIIGRHGGRGCPKIAFLLLALDQLSGSMSRPSGSWDRAGSGRLSAAGEYTSAIEHTGDDQPEQEPANVREEGCPATAGAG